jgi:hypothetical protein
LVYLELQSCNLLTLAIIRLMRRVWGCVLFAVLSLALGSRATGPQLNAQLSLNIHVRLSSDGNMEAADLNGQITEICPHNEINLSPRAHQSRPHISLYLTAFRPDQKHNVIAAVQNVTENFHPQNCEVELESKTTVVGSYGMWRVANSNVSCLQLLSDTIVKATVSFIVPDQPIPAWVKALPEPERGEKEAMIRKY